MKKISIPVYSDPPIILGLLAMLFTLSVLWMTFIQETRESSSGIFFILLILLMIVGIFNELTDKTEYVYKLIIDGDALQIIYRSKRKVSRTINIAVADIESLQLEATKAHFSGRGWMIETITFITLKDGSIFSFEQKKPSSRPYFFSLLKHRDVFPNFDYKVNPQCKDFKLLNWEASVMLKKSYRLQTILLVIFFILLFLFLAFGHG